MSLLIVAAKDTNEALAMILSMSKENVKKIIQRARKKLEKQLSEEAQYEFQAKTENCRFYCLIYRGMLYLDICTI